MFAAFDENEDGFVDPIEFAAGLSRMCSGSREFIMAHAANMDHRPAGSP